MPCIQCIPYPQTHIQIMLISNCGVLSRKEWLYTTVVGKTCGTRPSITYRFGEQNNAAVSVFSEFAIPTFVITHFNVDVLKCRRRVRRSCMIPRGWRVGFRTHPTQPHTHPIMLLRRSISAGTIFMSGQWLKNSMWNVNDISSKYSDFEPHYSLRQRWELLTSLFFVFKY